MANSKHPNETLPVLFDFSSQIALADGEIVSAVNTVTVSVLRGVDPSPGDILSGSASIVGDVQVRQMVSGGVDGCWYEIACLVTTNGGQSIRMPFVLKVESSASSGRILLRPLAVPTFRETLQVSGVAAKAGLNLDALSDDAIWQRLLAAEADVESRLRVFLGAVEVLPDNATDADIAALAGARYVIDPGYDFSPHDFHGDQWAGLRLRYTPVIEVKEYRFVHPLPNQTVVEVPQSWLRLDQQSGMVQLVPAGNLVYTAPLSTYVLSLTAGGRTVPKMIKVRYTAGLSVERINTEFQQVYSFINRAAIARLLTDVGMSSSSSISIDGMSESNSLDPKSLNEALNDDINELRRKLIGVRLMVL